MIDLRGSPLSEGIHIVGRRGQRVEPAAIRKIEMKKPREFADDAGSGGFDEWNATAISALWGQWDRRPVRAAVLGDIEPSLAAGEEDMRRHARFAECMDVADS